MDDRDRSAATEHPAAPTDRNARPGAASPQIVTRAGIATRRPLIAHVIFRLDYGGLENGLVNLVNGLASQRFRHAIVCIDDYTDFAQRIASPDVPVIAIHKRPGYDVGAKWRLYQAFRQLRPSLIHTRNLGALDALLPGMLAGVGRRIHGEHGWDVNDLGGGNRKLRWLRRLHAPLVTRYVALSRHLENYLVDKVGVPPGRIRRICNGVDVDRFHPKGGTRDVPGLFPGSAGEEPVVVGMVGRLQAVKDPLNLVDAFARVISANPGLAKRARLLIVGDGPLLGSVRERVAGHRIESLACLAGARDDVPNLLRSMDVFVQPSLAEGISNTILEAMASGLPVVATDVGGNAELVVDGDTGALVPSADAAALAAALSSYLEDADLRRAHGEQARRRAVAEFSIDTMVAAYCELYEEILA